MTRKPRRAGTSSDGATPEPADDATPAAVPDDDRPELLPVSEKIGEGGTNLRDRRAALGRRRGRGKPPP